MRRTSRLRPRPLPQARPYRAPTCPQTTCTGGGEGGAGGQSVKHSRWTRGGRRGKKQQQGQESAGVGRGCGQQGRAGRDATCLYKGQQAPPPGSHSPHSPPPVVGQPRRDLVKGHVGRSDRPAHAVAPVAHAVTGQEVAGPGVAPQPGGGGGGEWEGWRGQARCGPTS